MARSYIHSTNPSEAALSTQVSALAPATPPLSPTPSTLDLNIIPEDTDVNPPIEPAEDLTSPWSGTSAKSKIVLVAT